MAELKMPFGPPPKLERLSDWQPRLARYVNSRRQTEFAYGKHDCCLFARGAVQAVTGTLLLPDIELPIGFVASARFLLSNGLESVEELASALLGPPLPMEPSLSRAGDIVLVPANAGGEDTMLAVRVGDAAIGPGPSASCVVDAPFWLKAWPVGWSP